MCDCVSLYDILLASSLLLSSSAHEQDSLLSGDRYAGLGVGGQAGRGRWANRWLGWLGGGWLGWRHLLSQRISNGRTMRLPLPAHLRPGGIFHGYLASQQLVLFWHVIFDEYFYDWKATKAKINWKSMLQQFSLLSFSLAASLQA